jgi:hypothetical protein
MIDSLISETADLRNAVIRPVDLRSVRSAQRKLQTARSSKTRPRSGSAQAKERWKRVKAKAARDRPTSRAKPQACFQSRATSEGAELYAHRLLPLPRHLGPSCPRIFRATPGTVSRARCCSLGRALRQISSSNSFARKDSRYGADASNSLAPK